MMASLEVLLLMMTTDDIGFTSKLRQMITSKLLQERRLVWERNFFAKFCYVFSALKRRSTFLILKSRLESLPNYSFMNLLTSFGTFFQRKTNLMFIFLTIFTETSLKFRDGHILIFVHLVQNVLFRQVKSLKCSC